MHSLRPCALFTCALRLFYYIFAQRTKRTFSSGQDGSVLVFFLRRNPQIGQTVSPHRFDDKQNCNPSKKVTVQNPPKSCSPSCDFPITTRMKIGIRSANRPDWGRRLIIGKFMCYDNQLFNQGRI